MIYVYVYEYVCFSTRGWTYYISGGGCRWIHIHMYLKSHVMYLYICVYIYVIRIYTLSILI
jgi:hypothetical protein